eukprot:770925-Prymnesium_polylepis.1
MGCVCRLGHMRDEELATALDRGMVQVRRPEGAPTPAPVPAPFPYPHPPHGGRWGGPRVMARTGSTCSPCTRSCLLYTSPSPRDAHES